MSPSLPESVPRFAEVNGYGGMLVAPDRVLTAGHCVAHVPLSNVAAVMVGTEVRRGTRYAMHPGWRHANGRTTSSTTSPSSRSLGVGPPSGESWILGRGRQFGPRERGTARRRSSPRPACARRCCGR